MNNKKILITGGTGFLGAYIIKELINQGYAVRAIRRSGQLPSFISPEILAQVEWVDGDILDVVALEEAMQNCHTVIHAAAVVSFLPKEKTTMLKVNIEGTANVVNLALETGVQKLIYISSVAALGRTTNGEAIDESKKWEPHSKQTPYAISKYFAELEVWRGYGEGLETVVLNPSTILGFGDWTKTSSALFKNIYEEFPWYSEGINGFVGVEDVAKITVTLVNENRNGQRFIVNGDNWSFQQLFNHIADGFGKKRPHKKATPILGKIAWRLAKISAFFTGKKPLLTKESARVAQSKSYFKSDKLLATFPQFQFTPLQQVIEESCKQYLATERSK